jgi:hypothetical protein
MMICCRSDDLILFHVRQMGRGSEMQDLASARSGEGGEGEGKSKRIFSSIPPLICPSGL